METTAIHFIWLDYTILAILMVSTLLSIMRGFIREAVSLGSWILAVWVAIHGAESLSHWFEPVISIGQIRWFAAFVSLFLAVILVGMLLNYALQQVVKQGTLKNIDRVFGMVFGLARGVLLVTVIIFSLGFTDIPKEAEWKKSYLIPKFTVLADWAKEKIPDRFKESLGLKSSKG